METKLWLIAVLFAGHGVCTQEKVFATNATTSSKATTITVSGPFRGNTSNLYKGALNAAPSSTPPGTGINSSLDLPFDPSFDPEIELVSTGSYPAYDAGKVFNLYVNAVYHFWREKRYGRWDAPVIVKDDAFGRTDLRFTPLEHTVSIDTQFYAAWAAYKLMETPFKRPFDERSWSPQNWTIKDLRTGNDHGEISSEPQYGTGDGGPVKAAGSTQGGRLISRVTPNVTATVPVPSEVRTDVEFLPGSFHPSAAFALFKCNFELLFRTNAEIKIPDSEFDRASDLVLRFATTYGTSVLTIFHDMTWLPNKPMYVEYAEGLRQILETVVTSQRYGNMVANIYRGPYRFAKIEFRVVEGEGGERSSSDIPAA